MKRNQTLAKVLSFLPAEQAAPVPVAYAEAAVGGSCGCGNTCGTCAPSSTMVTPDSPFIPGTPRASNGGDYTAYVDRTRDARCLTPIASAVTPIPFGETVAIPISPSRGCAHGYYIKIVAVDADDVQTRQRALVGRVFIGTDCVQDCRIEGMYTDFLDSDDCLGCPMEAVFGMTAVNDQLQIEVTNINAGGSIDVQITVWARCLPGFNCARAACGLD